MTEAPTTGTGIDKEIERERLVEAPIIKLAPETDAEPPEPSRTDEEKAEAKQALSNYDLTFITEQLREDGVSDPETLELKFKKYIYTSWANPTEEIAPSQRVDAYWHKFVLNTEEYIDFCDTVFDQYLDHIPFVPEVDSIDSQRDVDEAMSLIEPDAPYRQTHTHDS